MVAAATPPVSCSRPHAHVYKTLYRLSTGTVASLGMSRMQQHSLATSQSGGIKIRQAAVTATGAMLMLYMKVKQDELTFSSLRLLVKQGADVSKAEDNAASNGLAGVPTTEQPIGVTHDPAHNTYIPQFEAPSLIAPKSLFVCHSALYTSLFLEASHSWEAQGHAGKT